MDDIGSLGAVAIAVAGRSVVRSPTTSMTTSGTRPATAAAEATPTEVVPPTARTSIPALRPTCERAERFFVLTTAYLDPRAFERPTWARSRLHSQRSNEMAISANGAARMNVGAADSRRRPIIDAPPCSE
jgi:hypothetical protein